MNRLNIYSLLASALLFTCCTKSEEGQTNAGVSYPPALSSSFVSLPATYEPTFNVYDLGIFSGNTGTCLVGMQSLESNSMELIISFQTNIVNWDTAFEISNDPQKVSAGTAIPGYVGLVDFPNYGGAGDTLFTFTETADYATVSFNYVNGVLSGGFYATLTYLGKAKLPATANGNFSFPYP